MNISLEYLDYDVDYRDYCKLLNQLSRIDYDTISEKDFNNHLKKIKSNDYHKIIVAKNNGIIIGSITVLIEPKFIHDLSYVAHIEDVVVDIEYRSNGVGSLLVKKALEIANQYNCYKIILDCSEKNIEFYKKNGFTKNQSQMALYVL